MTEEDNLAKARELCKGFNDVAVISKERFEYLEEKLEWLECLESAGVDNWSGYDIAIDIKNGVF